MTVTSAAYRINDLPPDLRAQVVVNPETGCWEWQHRRNANGYGVTYRDGRQRLVHCVVFTLLAEPIPRGLTLDHIQDRGCRSKACCWPAHLEIVTRGENSRRNVQTQYARRHAELARAAGRHVFSDEARRNLRSLLNEVEHDGEHLTILRYDTPTAVIVPPEWYEAAKAAIGETSTEEKRVTTYTAAITTAASDVAGEFCDVSVIENVLHGYTTDRDGNEVPDYAMGDKVVMGPVDTPVRTDDDDVLGKVEAAGEKILAASGWKVTETWRVADNALYADAVRAEDAAARPR